MKKLRVYIASPYTLGDVGKNVNVQLKTFDLLFKAGYNPYSPLWSHMQHIYEPLGYEEWMEYDFSWLELCEVVLRLPGESLGADREVVFANQHNMPVVYSVEELMQKFPTNR